MRQFHDQTLSPVSEHHELITIPGPLVSKTILENSLSDLFEEAKQQWEFVSHIPNESTDFVENCELCNHKNYIENWLIQNKNTGKQLKVGSDCIKRFIQFAGTSSQADSNAFFDIKQKELGIEIELRGLYKEVIASTLPLARIANRFKKLLKDLLEKRGQLHMLDTLEGQEELIKNLFKIENPSLKEINNFESLMSNPSTLPVQRETKLYKKINYKEGSTFKKRSKKVRTTLTNSKVYQDPSKKY